MPDETMPEAGDEPIPGEAALPGGWRNWISGRKGWFFIILLAATQAIFAAVLLLLRTEPSREVVIPDELVRSLSVDGSWREVAVKGITQYVRMPGGRHATLGMDLVFVLGELPEERIDGAAKPTEEEMQAFVDALGAMEPAIRDRANGILQKIPPDEYGKPETYGLIKKDLAEYVNDRLDTIGFPGMRGDIGKRRVTDVLLPMFVRQVI